MELIDRTMNFSGDLVGKWVYADNWPTPEPVPQISETDALRERVEYQEKAIEALHKYIDTLEQRHHLPFDEKARKRVKILPVQTIEAHLVLMGICDE